MGIKKIGCEVVDYINLAEGRVQWWLLSEWLLASREELSLMELMHITFF